MHGERLDFGTTLQPIKKRRRMENHADADHIEIFEPAGLDHNQLGADRHAGMQINNVLLQQADAAT